MISLDDDQECLTSFPAECDYTSASALMALLTLFTLSLLFVSVMSKEVVGLVSCCLALSIFLFGVTFSYGGLLYPQR